MDKPWNLTPPRFQIRPPCYDTAKISWLVDDRTDEGSTLVIKYLLCGAHERDDLVGSW